MQGKWPPRPARSRAGAIFATDHAKIAGELHRRKIEEFRDEKLVQKIRESSEELRELEEKLKAAYCTKERKAQIEEKQIVAQIRGEEEVGAPYLWRNPNPRSPILRTVSPVPFGSDFS